MEVTINGVEQGGASGGTPAVVLAATAVAGVATTFLRTDDQLIAFDATVPVTQASADAAATGTAAVAARRDHKHGMPTIGGAAGITRAGGNTTEATTTSITIVDLLTATGLTIATNVPIWFVVAMRKTTGHASYGGLGLKLNATLVGDTDGASYTLCESSSTNAAESRYASAWLGPRIANYNLQGSGIALGSGAATTAIGQLMRPTRTAAQPDATITDLIIEGIVANALNTLGADELHVYTLAVS